MTKLQLLYEEELGLGPFPTHDCWRVGLRGTIHGDLVLFLANIAGIASRGTGLVTIDPQTRIEFLSLTAQPFWNQHPSPDIQERVTPEETPDLYRLMASTEQARRLIIECLTV